MRRTSAGLFFLCAVCLTVVVCLQASGGVLLFTDRDSWSSAIGGNVSIHQSFDAVNISFAAGDPKAVAFPGFTIQQAPGFAFNISDRAFATASGSIPLTLTNFPNFDAAGFDLQLTQGRLGVQIIETGRTLPEFFNIGSGFFGFIATPGLRFEAFNFVSVADPIEQQTNHTASFSIDNVSLADVQAVPEPSSLMMFFAALCSTAGFVGWQRWQRWGNQGVQ